MNKIIAACFFCLSPSVFADSLNFNLPEAENQQKGRTRVEWNYTFLRDNRNDQVFNTSQAIGTRSNHRKTHLVTWRIKHGLAERWQPEMEIVYKAYRQHTHSDGDEHDRNDDGDFERLYAGLSYQLLQESERMPALRLRVGGLWPNRAETEGIGQEGGFDILAAASKQVGPLRVSGMMGAAMTFDNHDHPADPIFNDTPISKGHDFRTVSYGVGLSRPLNPHWQANLELDGKAFDAIQLNRRVDESELTLTPGVFHTTFHEDWEAWLGLGLPIGLTHDTDHVGVSWRMGARF